MIQSKGDEISWIGFNYYKLVCSPKAFPFSMENFEMPTLGLFVEHRKYEFCFA
mgnify:CR=1 FL=1